MAVPDYQSMMLPLLQLTGDREEHSFREAVDAIAVRFRLTPEDRRELLPSGRQPKFENRLGWARVYLSKAGLLEVTGRARFRITDRGLEFLKSHPDGINAKMFEQFPEFREFQAMPPQQPPVAASHNSSPSPEELLEASYLNLRRQVAQELLSTVKEASPKFFERLVLDLLVSMGYGGSREDAARNVGGSGDDGVDGIIKEDKLGLDNIYIQAKRWDGPVGRPVVQGFAGSLEGLRARKGVLITTSTFTQDARQYVERIEKKIVLIDGELLANLMLEHGVGVTDVARYVVKKVDLDYFTEVG